MKSSISDSYTAEREGNGADHRARLKLANIKVEIAKSGVTLCGKSRSLHEFQARLRHALIPEFLVIPLEHWGRCRPSVMRNCHQHFGDARLAVRSDAGAED